MYKENLWNDTEREIEILAVKSATIPLRLPQKYVEWSGFESGPHGE